MGMIKKNACYSQVGECGAWHPWRMSGLTFTPLPSSMSGAQLMVQLDRGASVVKG